MKTWSGSSLFLIKIKTCRLYEYINFERSLQRTLETYPTPLSIYIINQHQQSNRTSPVRLSVCLLQRKLVLVLKVS